MSILNQYKHTGKEFISELGVDSYDFSARFLAPLTGRFDSPDPKAWDYTWLSPYTFCAADPINSSDPTGMDTWAIDHKGRIQYVIKQSYDDQIILTDKIAENGKQLSASFEYNSAKLRPEKVIETNDGNISYSRFDINNQSEGFNMFSFLSSNTDVEWGYTISHNKSFLTNSHSKVSEYGGCEITTALSSNGLIVNLHIHSHPSGTMMPSGMNDDDISGDVKFAQSIDSKTNTPPQYYIFCVPQHIIINYNSTSRIKDFDKSNIKSYSIQEFLKNLIDNDP